MLETKEDWRSWDDSKKLFGKCLCGAIRITVPNPKLRPPVVHLLCHCRDCQRNAGAAFQTSAMTRADEFELEDKEGVLAQYMIPGTSTLSGKAKPKVFCSRCACTIYTVPARLRGKVVVMRTPLIDGYSEALPPSEEWFTRDRMSWIPTVAPREKNFDTNGVFKL